jgi:hypothetical protein
MKKFVFLLLLTAVFSGTLHAQVDTARIKENALKSAVEMSEAFIGGQYDKFIDYMHPDLVKLMGGRDTLKLIFAQSSSQGIEVKKTDIGKPTCIVFADSSIQCVLPQKQLTHMFGGDYETSGSLVGLSYNKGETWYFINATSADIANVKKYLPDLSDELKLDPPGGPTLKK